jgi:plasmid stability protein
MAQVLIRNLDDDVVARLRERAAREGRSLEAELRTILTEASGQSASVLEEIDRFRRSLEGRYTGDSVELIREDRER